MPGGELHTSFALGADGEFLALVDKDGTTIIDQYAPEFPAQLEDISYGRAMQPIGAPTTILTPGAAAKAIVPTSGALGLTWTQANFDDASWPISGPTGLGYDNNPSPVNYASLIQTPLPSGTGDSVHPREVQYDVAVGHRPAHAADEVRRRLRGLHQRRAGGRRQCAGNAAVGLADGRRADDAQAIVYEDFDVSEAIPHLKLGENVLAIHALNAPTGSDMLIVPELVAQRMAIIEPEMTRPLSRADARLRQRQRQRAGLFGGADVQRAARVLQHAADGGHLHADARRDHRLHDRWLDAPGRRQSQRHQRHAVCRVH